MFLLSDSPDIELCLKTGYPYTQNMVSVFVCADCGGTIYEDDWYWEYGGEQYCESCNYDRRNVAVKERFYD